MEKETPEGERAFIAPDVIISMITEGNKEVGKILDHHGMQLITSDFCTL